MTFAVKLSRASTKEVSVRIRTKDGTATSPDDYAAKADTLKIKAGQTKKKVHINTVGDTDPERNADLKRSHGIGTIIEDDAPSEAEANNAPGTANVYNPADPLVAGSIDPLEDVDYCSLTLGVDANVTIQTFDHGASRCADLADTFVTLYQPDGVTEIGHNDDGGDGRCSLITKPLTTGTYYIKVASAVGTDTFEYALGVTFQ